MKRTTRRVLLVLGLQLPWPLAFAQPLGSPPQDPIAGARVFGVKGCAACHAVTRAGPPAAPDLRRIAPPRSVSDVASAMWNHRPYVQQLRARDPRLDARETGNLLAFLFTLDYWDADGADGDARAGQRLFIEKKCVNCHQVAGTGGVVGPSLDSFKHYHSPILVAAIMWNHGPQMAEVMRVRGIERPFFRSSDLRDLIAYLKSESVAADPGPLYLLPGSAEQGRRIFAKKRCIECHSAGGSGPSLVGRWTGRDLTEFATAMWNKAPKMIPMMKKRAIVVGALGGDEMADLVAYLYSVGYFTHPGDTRRGQKLAADAGCMVCHSASGLGATVGTESIRRRGLEGPSAVISFAWNHALLVEEATEQVKDAWRPLRADEISDLMAFVRSGGRERKRDGTSSGTPQAP
jgi:mono/diheme cytochrome c family protein